MRSFAVVAAAAAAAAQDPAQTFANEFAMSWTHDAGAGTLDVTFVCSASKYCAVGLGTAMADADTVVCEGTVCKDGQTNGQAMPVDDAQNDVTTVSACTAGGSTTFVWRRSLSTGDAGDKSINVGQPTDLIWSWGDATATGHGTTIQDRSAVQITFACSAGYSGVNCADCASGYESDPNNALRCIACGTGYTGVNCTSCASGYESDPNDTSLCTAECPDVWVSQARTYFGCQRAEGRSEPWCVVDDAETTCPAGDPCACRSAWAYNSVAYTGCTQTGDDYSWCYVDDAAACNCTLPAVGDRAEPWRVCGMPGEGACPAMWTFGRMQYLGCQQAAGRDDPWCIDTLGAEQACTPSDCVCAATWQHEGTEYTGCAYVPGDDSFLWCYVNTTTHACPNALPAYGSRTASWRICGWAAPSQETACRGAWSLDPQGAAPAPVFTPATRYSYHLGCAQMGAGPPRCVDEAGSENTCALGECACQQEWTYQGQQYQGCADTGAPHLWCPLLDGSSCADKILPAGDHTDAWRVCGWAVPASVDAEGCAATWEQDGNRYLGCQRVDGALTCRTPAGAAQACGAAAPCACEADWTYQGSQYAGCADTGDDFMWCYVDVSAAACAAAVPVGGKRTAPWKVCGWVDRALRECKAVWTWNGVSYFGCQQPPGANESLCEAQNSAAPERVACEPAAGPCGCVDSWQYAGETYAGCAFTSATDAVAWCPLPANAACPAAQPAGGNRTEPWVACAVRGAVATATPAFDPQCAPQWAAGGVTYLGCQRLPSTLDAATVPAAVHDFATQGLPVCRTLGGLYLPCHDGRAITAAPLPTPFPADACQCQASWVYRGNQYSGCATPDVSGLAWCTVGMACATGLAASGDRTEPWVICGVVERPAVTSTTLSSPATSTSSSTSTASSSVSSSASSSASSSVSSSVPSSVSSSSSTAPCKASWSLNGSTYFGCTHLPAALASQHAQGVANTTLAAAVCYAGSGADAAGALEACDGGGPCACATTWADGGEAYHGCEATDASAGYRWCYLADSYADPDASAVCGAALPRGPEREYPWRVCGYLPPPTAAPCVVAGAEDACMERWNAPNVTGGIEYFGCQVLGDAAAGGVCMPKNGSSDLISCTPRCACKTSWMHNEISYKGCAAPDGRGVAWCVLEQAGECPLNGPSSSPPSAVCGYLRAPPDGAPEATGGGDDGIPASTLIIIILLALAAVACVTAVCLSRQRMHKRRAAMSCIPVADTIDGLPVTMFDKDPCAELTELEWDGSPYTNQFNDKPTTKRALMKTWLKSVRKSL